MILIYGFELIQVILWRQNWNSSDFFLKELVKKEESLFNVSYLHRINVCI